MCEIEISLCIQPLVKRKILNPASSIFLLSCVGFEVLKAGTFWTTRLSSPRKETVEKKQPASCLLHGGWTWHVSLDCSVIIVLTAEHHKRYL
jgi:hypothetical protein